VAFALRRQDYSQSHNSNESPSSEGLKRTTRSLRKRRGKKAGGQLVRFVDGRAGMRT
jgi:hypothetical protein